MKTRNSTSRKGFITIPLSQNIYSLLSKISFANTRVPQGAHTDTHKHRFFSAYLIRNMEAMWTDKGEYRMPARALVIVLPFVNHTWSNKIGTTEDCFVADLSPSHGKHSLFQ